MIVCHCAGVTDASIHQAIRNGARSVSEVAYRCGAGKHCDPCRDEIALLLSEHGGASAAIAD